MPLTLTVLPNSYSLCRFSPQENFPQWLLKSPFFALVRTDEELSIACESSHVPEKGDFREESGWRVLKVEGPLDFSLTGILAGLATTLSDAGVSLSAISTFDTDYLFVKGERLETAIAALRAAQYTIREPSVQSQG